MPRMLLTAAPATGRAVTESTARTSTESGTTSGKHETKKKFRANKTASKATAGLASFFTTRLRQCAAESNPLSPPPRTLTCDSRVAAYLRVSILQANYATFPRQSPPRRRQPADQKRPCG